MSLVSGSDLGDLLAQALPTNVKVIIRHISSTPSPSAALFAAPPGQPSESTFCENHFLSVSAADEEKNEHEIVIFGIEVLVYTTSQLTTIFISKADSTGFLHKLKVPPKVSLLRLISSTFLSFLVRSRQRNGVRLVLSLFARAQNQYLFPGSVRNPGKHVLDDRGLIKWWCRAVDPILRQFEPESTSTAPGDAEKGLLDQTVESARNSATAFLIVPGCDRFETRGFFPVSAKSDTPDRLRWLNSYPRHQLCRDPDAPPRCLVPRFPDDPKTRFLIDLDDELSGEEESGQWRSVKSLDQFWEMMSFRQECSAGRLVGFLWVVVNPPGLVNSIQMDQTSPGSRPVETSSEGRGEATITDSNAFYWPEAGRAHVVLSEKDYKSAIDSLLDLEFYDEEVSMGSTKTWVDKVATLADQLIFGQHVVGRSTVGESTAKLAEASTLMDSGLIRKRKKPDQSTSEGEAQDSGTPSDIKQPDPDPPGVNVLNASMVRKKKKP